jgi:quercetin dioxygenase-like cupin family protein
MVLISAMAILGASAQKPGKRRTYLQQHDLNVPWRDVIQLLVDFDPGATFGRHRHPGEEIVCVLEGSIEYRLDGRPPVTLQAGDVLFIPARTVHAATNEGQLNGAELATYIVEKGKPLVEMVGQ